jgi:hypothetical protein
MAISTSSSRLAVDPTSACAGRVADPTPVRVAPAVTMFEGIRLLS